ncbi:MAG: methyltransferase domain-containing protein [Deltaproteobacteria bacterium]|nr:methyltransferase domain-containing protein [Deltaproteobacteria bacterium]
MTDTRDNHTDLPHTGTGERYLPEMSGPIVLEHVHRYQLAQGLCDGKTVLDIASGEGYGSAMLASVAKSVIGVDISPEAVRHATEKYASNNLEFRTGSCDSIPVHDASVDVVVSFETIEHHDRHEEMFREIKRVLRPDGILIISSPDKHEYSDVPKYNNPYHVKELYREEFIGLIGKNFKHFALYGQRVVYGSGIFLENYPTRIVSGILEENCIQSVGMSRPHYFIAITSDVALPELTTSFLEQAGFIADIERQVSRFNQTIAERDAQISTLDQTVAERDAQISTLDQTVAELGAKVAVLQVERAEILSSTSWRITKPVRVIGAVLRNLFWSRFNK